MKTFDYDHIVTFQETNLLGNTYFTSYLAWQGRCRELFLKTHVPTLLAEFADGLRLVTTRCSCEFLSELSAFDAVTVRMSLGEIGRNRMLLRFDYWVNRPEGDELVASGAQEVACMREESGRLEPRPWPETVRRALVPYVAVGARAAVKPTPANLRTG